MTMPREAEPIAGTGLYILASFGREHPIQLSPPLASFPESPYTEIKAKVECRASVASPRTHLCTASLTKILFPREFPLRIFKIPPSGESKQVDFIPEIAENRLVGV